MGYLVNEMASSAWPHAARGLRPGTWANHGGATAEVGAMMSSDRRMLTGAGKELVAGAVGVAVMTLGEKAEQAVIHRPSSFVPAHTLERLLGLPTKPDRQRRGFNLAMHWGQGIALRCCAV